MSDGLAESLPLQHIVPGFLEHELTARYGHVGDQQTLLLQEMKSWFTITLTQPKQLTQSDRVPCVEVGT